MDTKKLRQKILDLAIRGKLVPQDPNDEPASLLLERIRDEKERLIKEGKIKRSKKTATDEEIEAPFEIPESWEWVKLKDIAYFGGGKTPSMEEKKYWQHGKHLWVTSKDMKCERIIDSLMKISDDALSIMTQYDSSTLLMVTRSGILKHSLPIAILDKKATVNQDIKTISIYIKDLADFVFYAIKANEALILKEYHKDGTTVDSINFEKFVDILLPLPPLAEQKRILNEVQRCFAMIDALESNEGDLLKAIDQAKSKILDLAIHGKLVPQEGEWKELKIRDAFIINPKNKEADEKLAGFVPMSNIQDGYRNSFVCETKPWGTIKKGFTHFADGDIAVAKISPCLENRKSMVLANLPNGIGAGTTELIVFRCKEDVFAKYGLYFFKTQFFIDSCVGTFNGVVGQQRVGKNIVEEIAIPLPPYQEQLRIVAKIEELFGVLDGIKEALEA